MKGVLIVADSARIHLDGTFSMLRAGIDKVQIPAGQELIHRGSVAMRISGGPEDAGRHQFVLHVEGKPGSPVAPDIAGEFELPQGGGATVTALDFGFRFAEAGTYRFVLLCDGKELDSWNVELVTTMVPTAGGAGK